LPRNTNMRVLVSVRRTMSHVAFAVMLGAADAAAQETRAGTIEKKQEEKAAQSHPYQPTKFEKIFDRIEAGFTSPPSGFFPVFGSVYSGGGFGAGPGYRRFFGRRAVWDIKALYTIRSYKQVELGVRSPWHGSGRVTTGIRAGWMDATQIGYYGLGMDTSSDDRANFRLKQTYAGGNISVRPASFVRLEADAAVEDIKSEEGLGSAPSIETRYNGVTAPGLLSTPTYFRAETAAAIDWRTSPGYSRRGGYYGVRLVNYTDRDDIYSFNRVDAEVIQHIPLLRETWVLSLHGRVQSVLDDDDIVPYYLLPWLGSGNTLRAYPTGRFRDRHSLLTSAEFRWVPNRIALDMAIFYDAGKVTRRREDLDFDGLKSNFGIGARFHGLGATPLRIELARGSEGFQLVFATSAAF
jgi:outer membrane protein assembly factor BamA